MKGRILGIVVLVIGFVLLFFARSIAGQIREGKAQIESGQSQLQNFKNVFSTNPYTKDYGNQMLKPYEDKIAQGQTKISDYESIVKKLRVGGVILIFVGLALAIIWGGGGLWRKRS